MKKSACILIENTPLHISKTIWIDKTVFYKLVYFLSGIFKFIIYFWKV